MASYNRCQSLFLSDRQQGRANTSKLFLNGVFFSKHDEINRWVRMGGRPVTMTIAMSLGNRPPDTLERAGIILLLVTAFMGFSSP